MTVYVDQLVAYPQKATSGGKYFGSGKQSCHMSTDQDDLTELHVLAQSIGLRREWFQDHKSCPHYDLTPSKRILAVKAGAVSVDWRTYIYKTSRVMRAKIQEQG